MNEGKSQTWFAYAAKVMKAYDIDYVSKADTDSLLHLDKYFEFAKDNLPPPPYNRNILAGTVADKWWWTPDLESIQNRKRELYYTRKYGKDLHLYVQGQWYLMSLDLAETVTKEAPVSGPYLEHHEDHDVSSMAFRASRPIHLIIIALEERHWQHRVKIKLGSNWRRIWDTEMERIQEVLHNQFGQVISKS